MNPLIILACSTTGLIWLACVLMVGHLYGRIPMLGAILITVLLVGWWCHDSHEREGAY